MNVKEIVAAIHTAKPEITSVYFVGCGASQSDLYPGQYFLTANAKKLRTSLHTANEFLYSTPAAVGQMCIRDRVNVYRSELITSLLQRTSSQSSFMEMS